MQNNTVQEKTAENLLEEQLKRMEHGWHGKLKKQQFIQNQMNHNKIRTKIVALSPKHAQRITNNQQASNKNIEQQRAKIDFDLKNKIKDHLAKQLESRSYIQRVEDARHSALKPELTPPNMNAPKPSTQFIEQQISRQMGMNALNYQKENYLHENKAIDQKFEKENIEVLKDISRLTAQENKKSMGFSNQKTENTHTQEKSGAEELREKLLRDIEERESKERENSRDDRSR